MPFCAECGNEITDVAKFCPNCGTKTKEVTKIVKKKIKKRPKQNFQSLPPQKKLEEKMSFAYQEEQTPISVQPYGSSNEEDTEYLKEFFTPPDTSFNPLDDPMVMGPDQAKGFFGLSVVCFLIAILILPIEGSEHYGDECEKWPPDHPEEERLYFGENTGECGLEAMFWDAWVGWWWLISFLLVTGVVAIPMGIKALFADPEEAIKWKEREEKRRAGGDKLAWKKMSPEPLFRRLDQAQRIVAYSSFDGLGINRSAKPSEGGVIRNPAYSYGPHLDFTDLIFGKVDKGGIGKGAGYYKICEDFVDGGLYTREYDMMVIQFTQNQILVYKCIFDILEMTKRLEESYEWNYKHVVGINISGDDTEKKLGASISVTGTKYMVISAASGDKIEIILGAETNELVDGKKKKSHLGGEDKIFEIANAAVKNVREAIRDKAG